MKRRGQGRLAEEAEQPPRDTHRNTETHRHAHAHRKTCKHTGLSLPPHIPAPHPGLNPVLDQPGQVIPWAQEPVTAKFLILSWQFRSSVLLVIPSQGLISTIVT